MPDVQGRDANKFKYPRGVPEMETNIVEKLLKGSAEIDRLRAEIDQVIGLLIGYLNKIGAVMPEKETGFDQELAELHFDHGVERWIVGRIVNLHALNDSRIFIELEVRPWDGERTIFYSEWGKKSPTVESAHVQTIHRALPRLVETLAERYPRLTKAWQPLLQATE